MRQIIILLIVILFGVSLLAQNSHFGKYIPSTWIKKAIDGVNKNELILEFGRQFPSKAIELNNIDNDYSYLNLTKVNLENGTGPAFLLFIGTSYSNTMFYVADSKYKIIYEEYLWLHNEYPELKIYNIDDNNKYFSYKYLYFRGSGHWLFSNKFFRLENGQVILAAELINNSNDTFNDEGINGMIKTDNIHVARNSICVEYSYQLYPHENVLQILGINEEKIVLINKEKLHVYYTYDSKIHKLVAENSTITNDMEKYFFSPGNDKLFLNAFSKEIKQLLVTGNKNQKKVIKYLLEKDTIKRRKNDKVVLSGG